MNIITKQMLVPEYPDLCIEINRYANNDTYRFFWLEPHEASTMHMNYRPFQSRSIRGIDPNAQNYIETERQQVGTPTAETTRESLKYDGYRPVAFKDLPLNLALFVCFQKCPIEWHSSLMTDEDLQERITIWVRGEFPGLTITSN